MIYLDRHNTLITLYNVSQNTRFLILKSVNPCYCYLYMLFNYISGFKTRIHYIHAHTYIYFYDEKNIYTHIF